jgi:glycosyltransferase involved in cell wall biosynthesis
MGVPISVVTSVYNGEAYLKETIESVLAQTFSKFEYVIVDDGSTDKTREILAAFQKKDDRIRVEKRKHLGRVDALNEAIRLAKGEYIAICDADDICLPERLGTQFNYLNEHPEIGLLGSAVEKITAKGKRITTVYFPATNREIKQRIFQENCFAHSALLIRRDAIERVGGYRDGFFPSDDYDLILRISLAHDLANLPKALVKHRVCPNQSSERELERNVLTALAAQVSAKTKKELGVDIMERCLHIDMEFLEQNGLTREFIFKNILDQYLTRAIDLWEFDEKKQSLALLNRALTWATKNKCSAKAIARIHSAFAARYFKQKRFLKAGKALARVLTKDPREVRNLMSRGLKRRK